MPFNLFPLLPYVLVVVTGGLISLGVSDPSPQNADQDIRDIYPGTYVTLVGYVDINCTVVDKDPLHAIVLSGYCITSSPTCASSFLTTTSFVTLPGAVPLTWFWACVMGINSQGNYVTASIFYDPECQNPALIMGTNNGFQGNDGVCTPTVGSTDPRIGPWAAYKLTSVGSRLARPSALWILSLGCMGLVLFR